MTYVVGDDPEKQKLKHDVEKAWYELQAWYRTKEKPKASELIHLAVDKAKEYGWDFAGHIVGKYPHEQPADPKSLELDIHPDNSNTMALLDADGNERHWILELQFVDREEGISAYFEQLL